MTNTILIILLFTNTIDFSFIKDTKGYMFMFLLLIFTIYLYQEMLHAFFSALLNFFWMFMFLLLLEDLWDTCYSCLHTLSSTSQQSYRVTAHWSCQTWMVILKNWLHFFVKIYKLSLYLRQRQITSSKQFFATLIDNYTTTTCEKDEVLCHFESVHINNIIKSCKVSSFLYLIIFLAGMV